MNLSELRYAMRKRRKQQPLAEQRTHSATITAMLIKQAFYQTSHSIACYFPFDGEVLTQTIINNIWQSGKNCYLPIINRQSKTLSFYLYRPTTLTTMNCYGINEPVSQEIIAANALDLVLVPLVAFDILGTRLGTGSGYYDRTFHFLKTSCTTPPKPLFIGLGYQFQCCDNIIRQPWDIPLDAVLTEKCVYLLNKELQ